MNNARNNFTVAVLGHNHRNTLAAMRPHHWQHVVMPLRKDVRRLARSKRSPRFGIVFTNAPRIPEQPDKHITEPRSPLYTGRNTRGRRRVTLGVAAHTRTEPAIA